MCQEKMSVSLKAEDLKKIVSAIMDGKYPFNKEHTPWWIARQTLNKIYEGQEEAASFNTACRLEELLAKAKIGTPAKARKELMAA